MAANKATSVGTTPWLESFGSPSQSAISEEQDCIKQSCLHRQLRKTKFCMYHLQGVCRFGDNCAFAHGCDELQKTPNFHKTRLCKSFASGECNDAKCVFAHSEEELRSTDLFCKKDLCMWYEKGRCRKGSQCRFAHGTKEVVDANLPGTGIRGPRAGNATVRGSKASQKTPHTRCQPGGKGATTRGSLHSAIKKSKGTTITTPDVNSCSLEPMFVQTAPRLGLQPHTNLHQVPDFYRQVDDLRQASAVVAQAVNHAQTATWMQDTKLRHYEWQMELRNASAVAATAASAVSDVRSEAPQSVNLQADLEKLIQNVATLSLQLSRCEMQIQDRMHPRSAHLTASASLTQSMVQLPEPPAPLGVGLHAGLPAVGPLPFSALFGGATNGIPEDSNPKKV